jgi:hypothetical protein
VRFAVSMVAQFLCKDLGGRRGAGQAHSLEFSKAARTAMIAVVWVLLLLVVCWGVLRVEDIVVFGGSGERESCRVSAVVL